MSVQTDADNEYAIASEAVTTAIKALAKIVIDECWGSDTFNHSHVAETMNQLLAIKDRLK